jgi:hypothetical protein
MEIVPEFNVTMTSIGTRCISLLLDIFSVIYSYDQIEIDGVFIHYCITLSIIFLSIMNMIRIEYIYCNNSEEENNSWKKENFTNTNYFFVVIENICKISFLFHTFPMEYNNLYTISILLIQISTILFLFMLVLSILYFFCVVLKNQPKRSIHPTDANVTNVIVHILNECSICLEINNNKIIKTDCNHEFHEKCLFEWIKISMTCPICRGAIDVKN